MSAYALGYDLPFEADRCESGRSMESLFGTARRAVSGNGYVILSDPDADQRVDIFFPFVGIRGQRGTIAVESISRDEVIEGVFASRSEEGIVLSKLPELVALDKK